MKSPAIVRALACAILLAGVGFLPSRAAAEPLSGQRATPQRPAAPLPAALPVARDTDSAPASRWHTALLLVPVLALAAGWWWQRRAGVRVGDARSGRSRHSRVVRVSSQALTPHASVHAVQWDGHEYLLGCTSQQVTLLSKRPTELRGDSA
jgi:flagellar biogenesis protein FliO